ncbi:hypothetical protein NHQ30_000221 [Ciborinia camelliae]|nr:hypothetical protein NHQ30_000221 [Ciborinia camelliae]
MRLQTLLLAVSLMSTAMAMTISPRNQIDAELLPEAALETAPPTTPPTVLRSNKNLISRGIQIDDGLLPEAALDTAPDREFW